MPALGPARVFTLLSQTSADPRPNQYPRMSRAERNIGSAGRLFRRKDHFPPAGQPNSSSESHNSEVGGQNSDVGRQSLEVGTLNSEVGRENFEVGSHNLEVREQDSRVRGHNSQVGKEYFHVGVLSCRVPADNFQVGTFGLEVLRADMCLTPLAFSGVRLNDERRLDRARGFTSD